MRRQIASGAIKSSTGSVGFALIDFVSIECRMIAAIECIDAGPMPPIS